MLRVLIWVAVAAGLMAPALGQDSIVSLPNDQVSLPTIDADSSASADVSSSEAPQPPAPCGGETISIAKMQWPSAQLLAEIHARLVKQNFGCDVEIVPGDLAATTSSMGTNGQPAVAPTPRPPGDTHPNAVYPPPVAGPQGTRNNQPHPPAPAPQPAPSGPKPPDHPNHPVPPVPAEVPGSRSGPPHPDQPSSPPSTPKTFSPPPGRQSPVFVPPTRNQPPPATPPPPKADRSTPPPADRPARSSDKADSTDSGNKQQR